MLVTSISHLHLDPGYDGAGFLPQITLSHQNGNAGRRGHRLHHSHDGRIPRTIQPVPGKFHHQSLLSKGPSTSSQFHVEMRQ